MVDAEKTVLIIDDDPDDRELFTEALADIANKLHCVECENGEKALKLLSIEPYAFPRVIFMDINMPIINGKDLLRQLKQDEIFKHIPIVMFTTSSNAKEMQNCYDLGANGFITKPGSYKKLQRDIAATLTKLAPDLVKK